MKWLFKTCIILVIFSSSMRSQYIENPSFEKFDYNQLNPPLNINYVNYGSNDQFVTRLGNCPANRYPLSWINKDYSNGWYVPTKSNPDYFRGHSPYIDPIGNRTVSIPSNYYGIQYPPNFPANIITPEQVYEYCSGFYTSTCGYVGIHIQKYKPTNSNSYAQFREYLITKLLNPLLKGAKYHVSFKVSLADYYSSHATNQIGAYFSATPIYQENTQPILVKPQIIKNNMPSPGYWLNNTGGADNREWMSVEDDLTVPEDLADPIGYHYLTIGNFNPFLTSNNMYPAPITGGEYDMFYYIDDVQITLVDEPPCWCGKDAYEATVTPHPGQNQETKCCYDFSIKIKNLQRACKLYGVKIFNASNPSIPLVNVLNTTYYTLGSTLDFNNICIDKTTSDVTFTIVYLGADGNPISGCPAESLVTKCSCDCGDIQDRFDEIYGDIEFDHSTPEKCCYNVRIVNNTNCFFNIKEVFLNWMYQNVTGIEVGNVDWSGVPVTSTAYIWAWQNLTSSYVGPNQSIIIGTICIPANGQEYLASIDFRVGSTLPANYCTNFSYILKCDDVVDCCDNITASLVNINPPSNVPTSSNNNSCCWWLNVSQINSKLCDIYKIDVLFDDGHSLVIGSGKPGLPFDFKGATGILVHEFCIPSPQENTSGTLHLVIRFLNKDHTILCTKEVSATCSNYTATGGANSVEDEKIVSSDEITLEQILIENKLKVNMNLKDELPSKIIISDILGNIIYSNDINQKMNNEIVVDCASFVSGVYICNIVTNTKSITKKFVIIK